MRVAEVARQIGISPFWLRELEKRGSIPPAPRDLHGHRRYSPEDVETVRRVVFGAAHD